MLDILSKIVTGHGEMSDLDQLERIARTVQRASLCALGKTAPNPVLSTIKYYRDEYEAHILHKKCPAGVCRDLITYNILEDKCTGCGRCLRNCPSHAITGERRKLHVIDQALCIQCGICKENCHFDAIEVS